MCWIIQSIWVLLWILLRWSQMSGFIGSAVCVRTIVLWGQRSIVWSNLLWVMHPWQRSCGIKILRPTNNSKKQHIRSIRKSLCPGMVLFFKTPTGGVQCRQLAECYGLLPHHSGDWDKDMQWVILCGICFKVYDANEVLQCEMRPVCKAQSIQLASQNPYLLTGQDKYLGGMASEAYLGK